MQWGVTVGLEKDANSKRGEKARAAPKFPRIGPIHAALPGASRAAGTCMLYARTAALSARDASIADGNAAGRSKVAAALFVDVEGWHWEGFFGQRNWWSPI